MMRCVHLSIVSLEFSRKQHVIQSIIVNSSQFVDCSLFRRCTQWFEVLAKSRRPVLDQGGDVQVFEDPGAENSRPGPPPTLPEADRRRLVGQQRTNRQDAVPERQAQRHQIGETRW